MHIYTLKAQCAVQNITNVIYAASGWYGWNCRPSTDQYFFHILDKKNVTYFLIMDAI